MSGLAAITLVLGLSGAVLVLAVLLRRRPPVPEESLPDAVRVLFRVARRRALSAVAGSATTLVVLVIAGTTRPSWFGLPLVLAPAIAGVSGLAIYAAVVPRALEVAPTAPREASLTPRRPWSHVSATGLTIPCVLAAAQIPVLILTGVTSSADEHGRYRMIGFAAADRSSAAGPYPGWFYGVPLILVTLAVLAATAFAFWRVSSVPAFGRAGLASLDEGWRRSSTRILAALSSCALLLQFGGVALLAGLAIHGAAFDGLPGWWSWLGTATAVGGLGLLLVFSASAALALFWTLTLPAAARGWAAAGADGGNNGLPNGSTGSGRAGSGARTGSSRAALS